MYKRIIVVLLIVVVSWAYQASQPPPPKLCGSPGGPPITAPRLKLRDGRHLAIKEFGVSKEKAKYKIIFVHGFGSSRHDTSIFLPELFDKYGVYMVTFDRQGYGESDPDPKRTIKSTALDIEDLADKLELGTKFYVVGCSMGGQGAWGSLKYIPHRYDIFLNWSNPSKVNLEMLIWVVQYNPAIHSRTKPVLAGVTLIAPVVNYWWNSFPGNISREAYYQQVPQDQLAVGVAHYAPWLIYWWNTQKWLPSSSVIAVKPKLCPADWEILSKLGGAWPKSDYAKQQGEFESIHRDARIGFGRWEFDPMEIDNPFPNNEGSVDLWHGIEDWLVPVSLEHYIVGKLPWIHYHEISGVGHMLPHYDGMKDAILKSLLLGEK